MIVTFAGAFTKIDCRQGGYIQDVQTGSPHDYAAARALCLGMFVRVSAVHDANWYALEFDRLLR